MRAARSKKEANSENNYDQLRTPGKMGKVGGMWKIRQLPENLKNVRVEGL